MQPTVLTEVFESPLSVMWFDEDGIFCTVIKKKTPITKEAFKYKCNFIKKHSGRKKICCLGDITHISFPTTEARDYAGTETPKIIKALALITNSETSKMIANVFLVLKRPPYPAKLFTNEKDAKGWLKQYL